MQRERESTVFLHLASNSALLLIQNNKRRMYTDWQLGSESVSIFVEEGYPYSELCYGHALYLYEYEC